MPACLPLVCFLVSAMVLTAGCAVSRDIKPVELPTDLPLAWTYDMTVEALPITRDLLALIEDDSLRQLVNEAINNNPNLSATALRLKAAGYFLSGPRSQRLPKMNAGYTKGRGNLATDVLSGDQKTADSHRFSFGISWEVDLWGRLADEYAASESTVRAQEYDYLHARDALAVRVIQTWIDQVAIRRSMTIEQERIAILKRIEQFLIERYASGIGNWNELSAAKSRTEIANADLSELRAAWNRSIRRLEVLLGRFPRGELLVGDQLPTFAAIPIGPPAAMLLNRPDIQAGIAHTEAARRTASAAKKAILPELRISGQIFRSSAQLGSIGGATTCWEILGGIFQPLFEGGRIINEAKGRHNEAKAALLELHHVVLAALMEVEDALDLDRELALQAQALEMGQSASIKSSRYFNERYLQGLDSIQSPLIANEQEMAIRLRLNQVTAARLSNRIDLSLALGVGLGDGMNHSNRVE